MADGQSVGAVLIGRNEGERLVAALAAAAPQVGRLVYVDSGSTDGSIEAAKAAGAAVVELDLGRPFTAARARNAGVARLAEEGLPPFLQFIDGDCALVPGWIDTALAFMVERPSVAVACGRRRERFPEASIYNRLCDREWDTPVGPADACGGDALMRADAFQAVGGFREDLIAGEEPELCLRLRRGGWEVWRLDAEMTLHDAAMTQFGQWWQRTRRAGHASAEGAALHGRGPERHGVRRTARALGWGLGLPAAAVAGTAATPLSLGLFAAYPAQWVRLARQAGGRADDWAWAGFTVLGKVPEAMGALEYGLGRLTRRRRSLIEYK